MLPETAACTLNSTSALGIEMTAPSTMSMISKFVAASIRMRRKLSDTGLLVVGGDTLGLAVGEEVIGVAAGGKATGTGFIVGTPVAGGEVGDEVTGFFVVGALAGASVVGLFVVGALTGASVAGTASFVKVKVADKLEPPLTTRAMISWEDPTTSWGHVL